LYPLIYINAQSLAIRKLLASGQTTAAREELARMEDAVQQVYADVREGILGLRTAPGSEGEFVFTLQSYLERYREMTGIDAHLDLRLPAGGLRVPPATEIQLIRIIQEALSNVRRHARASAVEVRFQLDGETLQVMVQDNGRGFHPDRLAPRGWPRFGLQTMRERTESVGGTFNIESRPGAGTRVLILLPVGAGEKVYAGPAG
jgi:signal transduction histidine kinase